MQAIILAAGMGKRLGKITQDKTKCMIKVNGVTLIERILSQIDERDFERVIIVTGYEENNLKSYIAGLDVKTPIIYVSNPVYDKTNNIYSLYLAKDYLSEKDTVLFESDLIFEDAVLDKIINNPYPSLALVAKYESWMDGTCLVLDEDDRIERFISTKDFVYLDSYKYYKTVNIYKFSKEFSNSHYTPFLEAYLKALGNNEYYEQVLRVITYLEKPEIKALRLDSEHWYEIDDIQDLDIAESIFTNKNDHLKKIEDRYGGYWRYESLIDFCYLVNPYFPDYKLISEMKANFERLIGEYPSGIRVNSLLAAKTFRVKQESIVIGNGAAELIKTVLEDYDGNFGLVYPTFEEYTNRLSENQRIIYIPDNPDFSYSAKALIDFFQNKTIDTLLLINPDNPSGNFIPYEQLLMLCEWTNNNKIRFIVDESFVDFSVESGENTLFKNNVLETYPYLIVIKSISKSYGVPGLRLGVMASSDKELISNIKNNVPIWNINSFAEFFMQIIGKYEKQYKIACQLLANERKRLFKDLSKVSFLRPIKSQANFILCEVLPPFTARSLATELLNKSNLLIKDCSCKKGFDGKEYIRIAVRNDMDNSKLIKNLLFQAEKVL